VFFGKKKPDRVNSVSHSDLKKAFFGKEPFCYIKYLLPPCLPFPFPSTYLLHE